MEAVEHEHACFLLKLKEAMHGHVVHCTRVLAKIGIPSGSWTWWVGVVSHTMTLSIEDLGNFAGETF